MKPYYSIETRISNFSLAIVICNMIIVFWMVQQKYHFIYFPFGFNHNNSFWSGLSLPLGMQHKYDTQVCHIFSYCCYSNLQHNEISFFQLQLRTIVVMIMWVSETYWWIVALYSTYWTPNQESATQQELKSQGRGTTTTTA